MCALDRDTLGIIIETRNNVQHIKEQLDIGNIRDENIETRVRKIELLFIPTIIIMTYFSNKIIELI